MSKYHCGALAAIMHSHGIRHVVLCPGSRNTPLICAIEDSRAFTTHVVVDERSAAFIALGMALYTNQPAAVVCTSGSALLNFAPAAAEAYYRQVPLLLISADRPREWIDQDDSQTIRQPGALHNIVRYQCDIAEPLTDDQKWYAERVINDACIAAKGHPIPGPVHINVQVAEPVNDPVPVVDTAMVVDEPERDITINRDWQPWFQGGKVLVVAGFLPVSDKYAQMLRPFADKFVVLAEAQSQFGQLDLSPKPITRIDATLRLLRGNRQALPTTVITLGGALLSRHLKEFLRQCPPSTAHIHVGYGDNSVDCFKHLRLNARLAPDAFFRALSDSGIGEMPFDADYLRLWHGAAQQAQAIDSRFFATLPWCDMQAMLMLTRGLNDCQMPCVHLSNGTVVRYFQLCDYTQIKPMAQIFCNRGVSGIDGCTSTAIGTAMACHDHLTVLITGDMSAQYDMGALATDGIPPRFRMAVLNNSGGGIFRFIKTTRDLPHLERNFCGPVHLPLRQLADGFGFEYLEARSADQLSECLPRFFEPKADRAVILNIITPPQLSAEILKQYFDLS